MLENTVDLAGYDILWRNKPELPVANEENRKLEDKLKSKKLEIEKLKVLLRSNISKGKHMREHINDLCQTLSYKQQLYKTREHELEMEIHSEKLITRECSRLEQEMKAMTNEINTLKERQEQRQLSISEQNQKRSILKSAIQWDEASLLQYLAKSAEMEKDSMALLKYTSEDDSKIHELTLLVEKLSQDAYEKKNALEDANTEVLIVQAELDRIQEEFRNAYIDRNNLINNWEKVINQIQHRSMEVNELSEYIKKLQEEQAALNHTLKEQKDLLAIENARNDDIDHTIREKERESSHLRNECKNALEREEDLKAQLSTIRNVMSNILYQKQTTENNLRQLEKQLDNRAAKIAYVQNANKELEKDIENLAKETFDADHYTKQLDNILQNETAKNLSLEKEVDNICKDILTCNQEMNELKKKEKFIDSQIKNKQTEMRNLNAKLIALDQLRVKQESEMYSIESNLEKLNQRVKKMAGETNEKERMKVEMERSALLAVLEEKKKALSMLTDELKIMEEKITLSLKELDSNKKLHSELEEKIKFLEFYIANSQKSLKCSISRKQEILVQECLEKFQMKRFQKLLNNKNKSVASLKKNKLEFETMMKERLEELKQCNEMVEAESRNEDEEYSIVKKKYREASNKAEKLRARYKIILDALGVSKPGESAEAEMLINAENEKRDLQFKRDELISSVVKNNEELSALRNTLWVVNIANEQFRQAVYPPGISSTDSESLKKTEMESQELAIQIHTQKTECKVLRESVQSKHQRSEEEQKLCHHLENSIKDKESEREILLKELSDLDNKMQRAERNNSRLSLDIRNKSSYIGIEEDIKIHLLREIRRTVSDLLFEAVENMPEIASKIQNLYEEANLPLPSRAHSSLSRSRSVLSMMSRKSSVSSPLSSARSSASSVYSPSIVTLGSLDRRGR